MRHNVESRTSTKVWTMKQWDGEYGLVRLIHSTYKKHVLIFIAVYFPTLKYGPSGPILPYTVENDIADGVIEPNPWITVQKGTHILNKRSVLRKCVFSSSYAVKVNKILQYLSCFPTLDEKLGCSPTWIPSYSQITSGHTAKFIFLIIWASKLGKINDWRI